MSDKMKVLHCLHQGSYPEYHGTFKIRDIPVRHNAYQEEKFGRSMSLHNLCNKDGAWRCTVCGMKKSGY